MHTFPKPLTPGEERSCLERMKEGDHEARNTLIERNLRLVAHVTRKYQGTDYEMEWNVTLVLPDLYMDLLCDLVFWYCIVRAIGIGTPGQAGSDDDLQDRDDRYRPVSDIVGL